jgi:hypothetical protein
MTTVLLDKCGRRFMSMVSKSKKEAEALIDGKQVPEALAGNREIMVLYRVIDHMTLSYHLKQSPLAVTLILSRNETRPESLQRGWRSSALGGCNLYEVPGDKMSKFRTPYLYDLSRLLSLVLLDVHRRA